MNFSKEEYKTRLKKVQSAMQEKGIELLISSDTANMNYLTGYYAWSFYYAQSVIDKLEIKINKIVLSSNQTLIWDSLNAINYKEKIDGFGKLFNS